MSVVMKFGGTSVGDAARMRQVAGLVLAALPRAPLVVLSAMSGVTNALFDAGRRASGGDAAGAEAIVRDLEARHRRTCEELLDGPPPADLDAAIADLAGELETLLRGVSLLRELSPRSQDAIASIGERLSTAVFAHHLRAAGAPARLVDARAVLRTDGAFGAALPEAGAVRRLAAEHLAPHLRPGHAVVTQGYIGATEEGLTTTLGRGGSDYSAALFGAALGAGEVQIWTDVEGVLTADPRIVPAALPIPELSFAEAGELAASGAKVLHPATIQPAVEARIPVTVRHTLKPEGRFTTITGETSSRRAVTAIASRGPITVLTVSSTRMLNQPGFLARMFQVFGTHGVSVDVVATAEVSVSATVEPEAPLRPLLRELSEFATAEAAEDRALVAVIGEKLKQTPGLAARAFAALGGINVEMISMGANEINLSLVVRNGEAAETVRRLHRALIEEASP